jgi:adhesin transport system outer membrane protein
MLPSAGEATPSFEWTEAPPEAPAALVEAIAIVTRRDPGAQAAWLGARAAFSDVKGTKWLRYPSIATELGVGSGSNTFAPSVTVEVPLWAGGQISSTISRAQKIEAAAVAKWHETVLSLALETAQTYWNIVLYARLEELYSNSLDEHQKLVASMQRRVNQEVSPLADLELAKSRTAQIDQELATVQAQRIAAMRNLAELVRDVDYTLGPAPQFDVSTLPRDWEKVATEVVEYNPSRARLILEADAARNEISVVRAGLLPRVSAQYSYNEITGSRFGIGLRLQASGGLSQLSAVSSATARYAQSLDQVQLSERQLRQEVATDFQGFDAAVRRALASREAAVSAQRVSQSYMRQFIAGRRSWLDVMNSLRESLSAQTGLAQAEVTAMSTSVRLQLRSGRWQPTRTSSKD